MVFGEPDSRRLRLFSQVRTIRRPGLRARTAVSGGWKTGKGTISGHLRALATELRRVATHTAAHTAAQTACVQTLLSWRRIDGATDWCCSRTRPAQLHVPCARLIRLDAPAGEGANRNGARPSAFSIFKHRSRGRQTNSGRVAACQVDR